MRGTTNTTAKLAGGSRVPTEMIDDVVSLAVSADDAATYALSKLEPPTGASLSNVRKGFLPLRSGPFIVGDGAARTVTVKPMRVARSSGDNLKPMDLVSAVATVDSVINTVPTAPGAGLWGYELLYAQISWRDSAVPTKGTLIAFLWATSPTYVVFANPANFATLPADTNITWNVPIAYVRNYNGQTTILAEDIIEVAPLTSGSPSFVVDTQLRMDAQNAGVDVRRAYSSADQDPTKLVSGSTSKWITLGKEATLTKTVTPIVVARRNAEYAAREIVIPRCAGTAAGGSAGGTAGTGGAAVADLVLDDTRDWRGANFDVEMWLSGVNATQFGEEDPSVVDPRVMPSMGTARSLYFHVCGQTHVAYTPHAIFGSRLWAAVFGRDADVQGIGCRNGIGVFFSAGEGWGIFADPTTGALMWWANRGGTGDGPPAQINVKAFIGNHRTP